MTKVKGVKKALLWPYIGLIVGMRLVSMGRTPILSSIPGHIIKDVPEIPFIIYCTLMFLSVVLSRWASSLILGLTTSASNYLLLMLQGTSRYHISSDPVLRIYTIEHVDQEIAY